MQPLPAHSLSASQTPRRDLSRKKKHVQLCSGFKWTSSPQLKQKPHQKKSRKKQRHTRHQYTLRIHISSRLIGELIQYSYIEHFKRIRWNTQRSLDPSKLTIMSILCIYFLIIYSYNIYISISHPIRLFQLFFCKVLENSKVGVNKHTDRMWISHQFIHIWVFNLQQNIYISLWYLKTIAAGS